MKREFKVSSIQEYIDAVEEIYKINKETFAGKKHLFFRGHSDKDYELLSTILRDSSLNEKEILNDFYHYSPRHISNSYHFEDDRLEILAQMQHNGIPTRLLDWTLAPLNALFFAVSEKYCKDGEVIVFNPWKYNSNIVDYKKNPNIHNVYIHSRALLSSFDDFNYINDYIKAKYRYNDLEEHYLEKPFAIISNFINDRILHQRGAFTIHGKNKDELGSLEEFKEYSWRIVIDKCKKEEILETLNKLYVNYYSIYPDFEGMKKQMNFKKSLFNL